MIISDEQAHLAARYLKTNPGPSAVAPAHEDVSADFVARVRDELSRMPETRDDRVASARAHLTEGLRDDEVAAKMIGRLISDSLR